MINIWSRDSSKNPKNARIQSTVLPRNIVVEFKSQTLPFILPTEDLMDFIIDLETTLSQRLNTKDFVFSYAVGVMGKLCYITLNSQVTFGTCI